MTCSLICADAPAPGSHAPAAAGSNVPCLWIQFYICYSSTNCSITSNEHGVQSATSHRRQCSSISAVEFDQVLHTSAVQELYYEQSSSCLVCVCVCVCVCTIILPQMVCMSTLQCSNEVLNSCGRTSAGW